MKHYMLQQVETFPFKVYGAGGDDLFNGHDLAIEAWGDRAKDKNSGMMAMAYLWRRFGPPWRGGDSHKSLVDYVLTTEDPYVFLWLHLSGCGLAYSVGYFAHKSIRNEAHKPLVDWQKAYEEWWWSQHPELSCLEDTEDNRKKITALYWDDCKDDAVRAKADEAIGPVPPRLNRKQWRTASGPLHRVNKAIFDALKELERPVYVRDCAINIFGRCEDSGEPVDESPYAGFGIPKKAMDKLVRKETDREQN